MTPLWHSGISIFISHSHADNAFGVRLVNDLRSVLGDEQAVWYDAHGGLHGGEAWWRKIVQEITTRNVFIVLLSPESLTSKWVQDEIAIAWSQKNATVTSFTGLKLIVPLHCRPCNVPADLRILQVISFLPPKRYEEAFNELLAALEQLVARPSTNFQAPPPPHSSIPHPSSGGAAPGQLHQLPLGITISLVALALLLVVAGSVYFARASLGGGNNNNNPTPFVTVPAQTQVPTSTPTPSPTATPNATATAQAIINATATIGPSSTNPYTQTGTLVLNDPLTDNSQGHAWLEGTYKLGSTCSFTNGAYQATQPNPGYFHACMAQATDYSNFAVEVQMTLVSGDYAGIVFRNANSSSYLFSVFTNGHYMLQLFDPSHSTGTTLSQGPAPSISLGQAYTLAVGAEFGNVGLYVNQQKIASVTDPTLTHGQIGVLVGNSNSSSAVALFSNAKVWA